MKHRYGCPDENRDQMVKTYGEVKDLKAENLTAAFCGIVDERNVFVVEYDTAEGHERNLLLYEDHPEYGYRICMNQKIADHILADMLCGTCGGYGQITDGNATVCDLCGGTGQQYNPNLYYDAMMGWTGGYMVCSGCGGSGYIGNVSYVACKT